MAAAGVCLRAPWLGARERGAGGGRSTPDGGSLEGSAGSDEVRRRNYGLGFGLGLGGHPIIDVPQQLRCVPCGCHMRRGDGRIGFETCGEPRKVRPRKEDATQDREVAGAELRGRPRREGTARAPRTGESTYNRTGGDVQRPLPVRGLPEPNEGAPLAPLRRGRLQSVASVQGRPGCD